MIRTSTVRDLLATGAGLGIGALAVIVWATRSIQPGIDLAVYLRAGEAALSGEDLYSPEFGAGLPTPLPFTYPPIAAIAAAPLSSAPFWLVFSAWTIVSVGALAWLVQISFGSFLDLRRHHWFLLGLWAGLVTPVADSLALGQVSGILVPLVFFAALGVIARGRSGPTVGVFTAIKLTPGLFILWFALLGRWRAVVVNLSLVALLTGLGLALLPSSTWVYFSSEIWGVQRVGNPASYMNQSLNGALTRLGAPQVMWMFVAAVVAILGLTAATVLARKYCVIGAISLVGLTSLLVSPISWQHHAIWALPATAVCIGSASRWARSIGFAAAFLLLLRLPLLGTSIEIGLLSTLAQSAYVAIYLALCAGILLSASKVGRQEMSTQTA